MKLFDLSFRLKLPMLGALLIVVSAFGVASALMLAAHRALREDLRINTEILGRSLAPALLQHMLHGDVWNAFETVRAPGTKKTAADDPVKADMLLVVDRNLDIFVSSSPKTAPVLMPMRRLGADFAALAAMIPASGKVESSLTVDLPDSDHRYVLTPIADDRVYFGTLIIGISDELFLPRFYAIAKYGLFAGLLVLALLLPVNWYWGRRMALPLAQLTERMGEIGSRLPANINPELYDYGDELGRLFKVFNQMLAELRSKEAMEKQIVQSERLAALGQLAAAVAHEINNPLGGMLTAIDTLKHHGELDPRAKKTVDLIERGLTQIKETVGALLVEARMKSRSLCPQDIDDVLTLVAPQAHKRAVRIATKNALDADIALPATLIRQILLNLVLNALAAAPAHGEVECRIDTEGGRLRIHVGNAGEVPAEDDIARLFEPFFSLNENGHGLGLWVTYQIVHQLGGTLAASRHGERLHVDVDIPFETAHD